MVEEHVPLPEDHPHGPVGAQDPVLERERTLLAKGRGDPASARAYWAPAISFLRAHLTPSYRVEVVDTTGHWAAVYLAEAEIPLARGGFRHGYFPGLLMEPGPIPESHANLRHSEWLGYARREPPWTVYGVLDSGSLACEAGRSNEFVMNQ